MKKKILGLFIAIVGVLGLVMPVMGAQVQCKPGTLRSGEMVDSYAECNTDSTQGSKKVWDTVKGGINTATGLIGVIAVIMVIYGGFQYMTSSGDANKVAKAKNTILYGIIGLVIAVLAFAIVNFVIGNLLK